MTPKLVLLWTDMVLYAMLLLLAWYAWRVRLNPNLRANWARVARDPAALCAGIVLALFALVTLVDSVHFRRALPAAAGAPAGTPTFYATSTESLLDAALARQVQMRESGYSEPLAYLGFNMQAFERDGQPVRDFPRLGYGGAHLATMARLNISYDLLTWESAIIGAGLWKSAFEMLRDRGVLEHPEEGPAAGCWIVPFGEGDTQTDEGERMSDKILVKSDGTATYTGKDIAYQLWKFGLADSLGVDFHFVPWGRQHDGRLLWTMLAAQPEEGATEADPKRFGHGKRVITVIDVRQSYLQQVVYECLRRLGYVEQADNSTHFAYEVVTLSAATAASLGVDTSDGHESYAMSGRKGIEVKADDLINTAIAKMQEAKPDLSNETAALLAASAIRYFMIRFNQQQIITLDMDEALRANGDTGVYLQYAYARANSILRKLDESGYAIPDQLETLPDQLEQSEWELLRQIDAYPRTLADTARQLAPNALAAYVYDLAAHFSDFYEHTPPILKESNEAIKAFRAHLVRAAVQTMANALRLLGFVPLERI